LANRYAVSNGNWSSALTWDGLTTIPSSGDIVRPNTFTITIDQDITVAELRNDAAGSASAGGGFVLSPSKTVTANITNGNTTALLTFSSNSPNSATINGNIISGSGSAVVLSGTGSLNITGNVTTGGSIGDGITVSASGTLNITGNVTGGPQTGGQNKSAIQISAGATVNVTGTVSGSTTATTNNGIGITISNASAVVNIIGNVAGGNTISGVGGHHGILINSSSTISVTGNVTGGSVGTQSMCNGINAIFAATAGSITVNGTITSGNSPAIFINHPGTKIVHTGNLIASSNGVTPISGGTYLLHSSNTLTHTYYTNNNGNPGTNRSLYTGGTNLGQPIQSDVRYGTTFGASNEYIGSLRVPNSSYVSQGVLVDNTTGTFVPVTAATLAAAVWNELRSNHATTGSYGNTSEYTSVVSDVYYARINFIRNNISSKDEYTVSWFKNGIRQTSGITSSTISVTKRTDGTNLINNISMTQVGSTGTYMYDESINLIALGSAYIVVVSAVINSVNCSYSEIIGRDS
jgi:hypothetical protein